MDFEMRELQQDVAMLESDFKYLIAEFESVRSQLTTIFQHIAKMKDKMTQEQN